MHGHFATLCSYSLLAPTFVGGDKPTCALGPWVHFCCSFLLLLHTRNQEARSRYPLYGVPFCPNTGRDQPILVGSNKPSCVLGPWELLLLGSSLAIANQESECQVRSTLYRVLFSPNRGRNQPSPLWSETSLPACWALESFLCWCSLCLSYTRNQINYIKF